MEANPETLNKIEEKLHAVEEVAQEKLHDLTERLHLTRDTKDDEKETDIDPETNAKAAKK